MKVIKQKTTMKRFALNILSKHIIIYDQTNITLNGRRGPVMVGQEVGILYLDV